MLPTTRFEVYNNDKDKNPRRQVSLANIFRCRRLKRLPVMILLAFIFFIFFFVFPSNQTTYEEGEGGRLDMDVISQGGKNGNGNDIFLDRGNSELEDDGTMYMNHNKNRNNDVENNEIHLQQDKNEEVEDILKNIGKQSIDEQIKTQSQKNWDKERSAVISAFDHAWKGYKKYAWGKDELHPISQRGSDWLQLGLTLVDSLDLLILLDHPDLKIAEEWIEKGLSFTCHEANLFETTIRVLGGLLSAHSLSASFSPSKTSNPIYLPRATDLADRLMAAFTSQTPVPFASVNLATLKGIPATHDAGSSSTSEVSTIQLEFSYISHLTSNEKYQDAADKVIRHIKSLPRNHGLVPIFISPHSGRFSNDRITLGARGDSYYEYLLKQWIQRKEQWHRDMYDEAVEGIRSQLVDYSKPSNLVYIAELSGSSKIPKMDHLVCFLPGVLALGAERKDGKVNGQTKGELTARGQEDFKLAEDLMYTCYQMYAQMPTGLSPEIVYFNTNSNPNEKDIIVKPADTHNLLRPETVESLFILFRITGDEKYRKWGWEIFEAFEKHTKVENGYSSLNNVLDPSGPKRDKMESFFLGETLKYLFLLFSDPSLLSLDEYVFNTEAHPFPILNH